MKKLTSLLLAGVFAASLLTACGGTTSSSEAASQPAEEPASTSEVNNEPAEQEPESEPSGERVTLTVGASPAPHAEILEQVIDVLADQGIDLVITEFSDYVFPNLGVDDGSLDANYFQHIPYLENFNAENGTNLVNAGSIHIEPMGVYGGKADSLDDLTDGALIGIPGDATNGGRALLLLESLGFITLKEGAGLEAEVVDIEENPHNLKFYELEAAQLPAQLPDFDFAVINGNYAIGAGINETVLATEGADSPYVNVIAVNAGDESREEIKALVAALQSEEIRTFIENTYGGEVIAVF